MSRPYAPAAIIAFLAGLVAAPPLAAAAPYITVASTTSTEQSGLFDHLLPRFREATGIDVRVVAVGTGQAFEIGRRGDADALLVHDRVGENAFVDNGYGIDRRDVMYNDFVLVGPGGDPAGVTETQDSTAAFAAIADAEAAFASRGDDSGTHRMERRQWQTAGVEVDAAGGWYRELGSGMGPTLNTAAGMDAYTLTDRATWTGFRNRRNLEILFEGDPALHNPYGSILVDPERHPHVKVDAAREWHEWITSAQGRQAIADFTIAGEQVFFVD